MEENEIKYIPYGTDEIDYNLFITNAANEVLNYVNSQSWSNKRKESFLNAYLNLISQGITGASNDTGIWRINHNGDIPLETLSKRDREMYGEAAYFLRLQMSRITPRKKEEEKKKEDLEKFGNFGDNLMKRILRGYGNNSKLFEDSKQGWDAQDDRGANGLRGTEKRRAAMIAELEAYKKELDNQDLDYNFEETSFKDKADLQTKIQNAIDALKNTPDDESDDLPAFNALGLPYRAFFSNGGNDVYGTTSDGKLITYQLYYENQLKEALEKAKAKAEALKAIRANYWDGYKSMDLSKYQPRQLTALESNIEHLQQLFAKDRWSGDEASQIVLAFKLAEQNGHLVPLSKEELARLNPTIWKNRSQYLKKIKDVGGLYYDTLSKQYKKFYKNGQTPQTSFLDVLNLNNTEALKEKQNKQAAVNMNTPLSLMTEWTPEMKKEILAIAWDAASIFNPEAFSGSAMALYASHLRDEANPNRGTLEKWLDRGTAALGGIQGVGDLLVTGKVGYRLYLLGKSIGSVSKFAGMLGAGFGAIGAFEARDSIAKLATDYESLTPLDIENISYGLMGLIGLKSFAKARNKLTIGKQANPTTTEYNITIKDKNNKTHEIKIDEAAAKEILLVRTFGKKKETVDSEILNMPKIKESIQKYKEANPTKKLEIEGASIVNDSKSAFGISGKNKLVTSNKVKNPNAPEYAPVGTKRYNPFGYMAQGNNKWGYYLGGGWQRKAWENAVPEHSSKGLWLRAKEFWNPEPKPILSETPKTTETKSNWSLEKIDKYLKNLEQMENSFLNRGKYNPSSKSLKKIDLSKNVSPEKYSLADGKQLELSIDNGVLNIKGPDGINVSLRISDQLLIKKVVSDIIKNYNNSIGRSSATVKRFSKEYIESLKELRRKGYLFKQGGTISDLDTEVKEILKTL